MPANAKYNLAVEELEKLYFRTYLQIHRSGFLLRWEKGKSCWRVEAETLDQVAELALGWIRVRKTRDGDLRDYAERYRPQ